MCQRSLRIRERCSLYPAAMFEMGGRPRFHVLVPGSAGPVLFCHYVLLYLSFLAVAVSFFLFSFFFIACFFCFSFGVDFFSCFYHRRSKREIGRNSFVNETCASVTLVFEPCCVTKMLFTRVCMGTLQVCFIFLKFNVLNE